MVFLLLFFSGGSWKKNCISIFYLCGAVLKMTCAVDHEVIVNNGNEYIYVVQIRKWPKWVSRF